MTWSSLMASLTVPVSTSDGVRAPHLDPGFFRHQFGQLGLQRFGIDGDDDVLDDAAAVGALQHHVHGTGFLAQEEQLGRTEQRDLRIGDAVGRLLSAGLRRGCRRRTAARPAPPADRHGWRLAADDQPGGGKVQPDHPGFAQRQDGRRIDHHRGAGPDRPAPPGAAGLAGAFAAAGVCAKADTAMVVAASRAAG